MLLYNFKMQRIRKKVFECDLMRTDYCLEATSSSKPFLLLVLGVARRREEARRKKDDCKSVVTCV